MPPFGRADAEWADVAAFYRRATVPRAMLTLKSPTFDPRNWLEFCSRKATDYSARSPVFVDAHKFVSSVALLKAFGHADPSGPFLAKGCSACCSRAMLGLSKGGIRKRHRTVRFEERWSRCFGRRSVSKTNMLMLQFMDQENKKARQALDEVCFSLKLPNPAEYPFFSERDERDAVFEGGKKEIQRRSPSTGEVQPLSSDGKQQ